QRPAHSHSGCAVTLAGRGLAARPDPSDDRRDRWKWAGGDEPHGTGSTGRRTARASGLLVRSDVASFVSQTTTQWRASMRISTWTFETDGCQPAAAAPLCETRSVSWKRKPSRLPPLLNEAAERSR